MKGAVCQRCGNAGSTYAFLERHRCNSMLMHPKYGKLRYDEADLVVMLGATDVYVAGYWGESAIYAVLPAQEVTWAS